MCSSQWIEWLKGNWVWIWTNWEEKLCIVVWMCPKYFIFQNLRAFSIALSFWVKTKAGEPFIRKPQTSLMTIILVGSLTQDSSNYLNGLGTLAIPWVFRKRGEWYEEWMRRCKSLASGKRRVYCSWSPLCQVFHGCYQDLDDC